MGRYIFKRLLMLIPVLLGVTIIIFTIKVIAPGDPVDSLLPESATEEDRELKREELGLNDPIPVQFGRYIWGIITRGDLGTSYKTGEPVLNEVLSRMKISVLVCFGAVILGVFIGVPLGIISAVKKYTWIDSLVLVISMIFSSLPNFCLALFLIFIFAVNLNWVPATGISDPKGFILPVIVIALISMSRYTRITRSSMLETLSEDYVRTARAKGQTEGKITVRHALRNALIPVITAVGNQMAAQLGGALIIENVFGIPGVGKYMADAILSRNYPAVQGGVFCLAVIVAIVNLIVDIIFVFVDPRLKNRFVSTRKTGRRKLKQIAEGGL